MREKFFYLKVLFWVLLLNSNSSYGQLTIVNNDTTICTGASVTLQSLHQARTPIPIPLGDDTYSSIINLGFNFTFYGNTYSSCVISSNGYINFNTANAGQFSPWQISGGIPGNTNTVGYSTFNSIFAAYADWDPTMGGSFNYAIMGASPNRKFILTFCDLPLFSGSCNNLKGNFQVVLYETTNVIDIHLGRKPYCSFWPTSPLVAGASIQGLQNSTGTAAHFVSGRNWPFPWTSYHSSYRFTPTSSTNYTITAIPYALIPDINVAYAWYQNDVTQIATTQNITVSPSSTTFYTVRKIECADTLSDTVVVTVGNPPVSLSAANNPTTCNGTNGSIVLSGLTSNTSYLVNYSKNGVPQTPQNITSGSGGMLAISGLTAGSFTNFSTGQGACNSTFTGPVILTDPTTPAAPVLSGGGTLCVGDNLNMNASTIPGAVYSWTGPSFSSSAQNPTISNVQTTNSGVYSVTVSVNNCTSIPATTNVVINPIPTAPVATNSGPICEGGNIVLNASTVTGASYNWTGPGFSSSTQSPTLINPSASASGSYSVTATVNGCTSSVSSTMVTVKPTPAAPVATLFFVYCQGEIPGSLVAAGQNLLWYTTPVGGAGSSIAPVPSTSVAGTFNWYVSQTVNGCESPRSLVTVTVNSKPQKPTVTSSYTYCQFESPATLTASGQNLLWYTTATGGIGSATVPTPSTSTPGTFNWYVSQTVSNCESDRALISVAVGAKPNAPVVQNPILFCQDETNPVLNVQGQNLKWYNAATGGTPSTSAPALNTSATGTTNYYVSQTTNGCESERSLVEVMINEKVAADIKLSRDAVCEFDTILVTSNSINPTAAVYNWSFDGGKIVNGIGEGPYLVKWESQGAKSVTLVVSNGACYASDSKSVNVNDAPEADFVLREHACINEMITVQAAWNSISQASYQWNFDDAIVLNGTGPGLYKLKWDTPGEKVLSLTINANGCSSPTRYDTIMVHENPLAKIERFDLDRICNGDELIIRAEDVNSSDNYNYVWTPLEFFSQNGTQQVTATIKSEGVIGLQVIDPYGCYGKDELHIPVKPCCEVAFADAFTPNNDGRNDYFRMITNGNNPVISFRVFNRWGQTVYETANNKAVGWDGTFNGTPQDMGTYFYYVRYRCEGNVVEKKGEVILVR